MPDDEKIQLTVQINSETGALEVVGQKLEDTGRKAEKTGAQFGKLSGEAGNLLKSFLPLVGAAGIIKFFADAVNGAEEENQALIRLNRTLGISTQEMDRWSKAVQSSTRFSDTQALVSLDKLARVTGNLSQAQAASVLAMNLSVAANKPLEETTRTVTDLLNGNQRALMEVNREYKAYAGNATTTQQALDNLSNTTRNLAQEEQGQTRQLLQMKNAWGELSDTVGNFFAPAVTFVAKGITSLIGAIDDVGRHMAQFVASAVSGLQGLYRILQAGASLNRSEIQKAIQDAADGIREMNATIAQQEADALAAKNTRQQISNQQRLMSNKLLSDEELRQKQEQILRIEQMEAQLDQAIAGLGVQTYQKKLAAHNADVAARRAAINRQVQDEVRKQQLLQKLNEFEKQGAIQLAKENVFTKQQQAFEIANTAIQTLQTLNSLGDKGSASERARAKALLALQQAVTIGWIWVAAAKSAGETGIFGAPAVFALAATQTALAIAQYAAQSKAIDQAANREAASISGISINPPGPGIDFGGAGPILGTGNNGAGASFSGGGGGGGGGGGIGGGGGTVTINVGGIVVNFDVDRLSVDNVDAVMLRIVERLRQGTIEAVQLAIQVQTVANKNPNLAA